MPVCKNFFLSQVSPPAQLNMKETMCEQQARRDEMTACADGWPRLQFRSAWNEPDHSGVHLCCMAYHSNRDWILASDSVGALSVLCRRCSHEEWLLVVWTNASAR